MTGILLSSFLLLIVGLLDDYFDVSPYLRFGANIFISALVISYGLGIPFISNPFGAQAAGGIKKLFMTHPPVEERVAILRDMLGAGK
jgi:UDP-GlcNAc:undecaprenyl-phosphate GlcNAc-1-phosphate transferase